MHRDATVSLSKSSGIDGIVARFLDRPGLAAGHVSVWLGPVSAPVAGPVTYAREQHRRHYAASTMKLPLLVAAYRCHERGEVDLDAEVEVHSEFASVRDGSPFRLARDDDQDEATWDRLGSAAPLRWLARQSIVCSGNLATNLVLEHVGADEVARVLADAGCTSATVLPRGIEDAVARRAGVDNLVTAHDLARVTAAIVEGRLGPAPMCAAVEDVLAQQEHRDKIPAGLPPGTYVANKTGWVNGVAHDVALVRPDDADPYVLAVCTTVEVSDEEASALIAEISRAAWRLRRP